MKQYLTNRQISLLLFAVIVGYEIVNLPKNIVESAGTGGWITLIINTLFFMFMAYVITYIQYNNENKILYEYTRDLYGKYISTIITTLYILYFMLIVSLILRMYSEVLRLVFLNKTPIWATLFVFYFIAMFAVSKKLHAIGRLAEIYSLIVIIGYLFIIGIMLTKAKLINVQPFFESSQVKKYLKSTFNLIFPFLGIEAVFFIPLNKKNNTNIFKHTILTILGIGILYIIIFESVLSIGGIENIINQKTIVFQTLRGLDVYKLETLRRLDGLYLMFSTMNLFTSICVFVYGTTNLINEVLPKIKTKYILLTVTIAQYIISLLPRSVMEVESGIKMTSKLGIICGIVIPLIIFITMQVKKNEKV
ncbi:GerAB/ArcD/ProY family transporter [Anaerosalibacter sp. Marseille-P3206]|uniref:GerAB/ArcD/ProY family transporter n=1 Tax=Anaerosalibacter sp. Marseille-P3206 TaxID=1871005 RepID=UPI00098652B0|nr:endospore germination permease [Anaerosalibacter sp. Marseille-P3206]